MPAAAPTRSLTEAARALLSPSVVDLDPDPGSATPRYGRVPSLLDQVRDAVESSRGTGARAGAGHHRAPIGLSAVDVLADIESRCGRGPAHLLTRRVWAWVRVHDGDPAAVVVLDGWTAHARAVVDPPRPIGLRTARCPHCRARSVRVLDGGEWVRRPALMVDRDAQRAVCGRCGTEWGADRLALLAAVLEQQGADDPDPPAA